MNKVKVGVVGVGTMGKGHVRTLNEIETCVVSAVCDIDEVKIKALRDEKLIDEKVKSFSDYRKLISSGLCDCVAIVTPHPAHLEIALAAFKAGLHVMCDKPITCSAMDADRMIGAWEKTSVKFSTMYSMRANPCNKLIKEWIESGRLGTIRRVEMTCTAWLRTQKYYNEQSWRGTWKGEGGGLLMNQAPHNLDLLYYWFGPAKSIWASLAGRYHDIETEDEVFAKIVSEKGFPIIFSANTGEFPGKDYVEIVGTKGTLVKNDGKLLFRELAEPIDKTIKESEKAFATPEYKEQPVEFESSKTSGHKSIFMNLFDSILKGLDNDSLIAPGDDGIHSVEWANAMLLSKFSGEEIKLPVKRKTYNELMKKLIEQKIKL
ncbi:MAG: hypothetical protein A2017_00640 [Lentisphaerae bacterium GWF2_44_16]|nr:MAG: hypothetical protein A2017_00640 [Lentisphaerae bacterium GWF2_44_16]